MLWSKRGTSTTAFTFTNWTRSSPKRYQAYRADRGNDLVDGVHTATEMQKLLQTSVQIPQPRYRFGKTVYINESKSWIHDPAARSRFTNSDLAKLDAGLKEAVRRLVEETGEAVPDLEKDGKEGSYPELFVPQDIALPEPGSESPTPGRVPFFVPDGQPINAEMEMLMQETEGK